MRALTASAGAYVSTEAANVEQNLLNAINAPTQTLLGRPLIGNGADGGPEQPGGPGGLLLGGGGHGGNGGPDQPGGAGGSAILIGNGGNVSNGGIGGAGGTGGLLLGQARSPRRIAGLIRHRLDAGRATACAAAAG
ncbi:hypothetical protein A4G28_07720 [Mycobacterium ostraviense]|uniref:PE family protein n=1 Tax=Mycobacterium ostraviense TaxID=2738409 RepID=A0A164C615_9MYCO|nr:hypothetical protein A4G28_07720 [Mycobacterium ostraviense]